MQPFKKQPTAIRPMISVLAMLCFATATSSLAGGPRRLCHLSNPRMLPGRVPDTDTDDILCPPVVAPVVAFDADQLSSPPTAPKQPLPTPQRTMKSMAREIIRIIKIKNRKTITTTNESNEHCCAKPNHQCIADTESNASASVGTETHKWGVDTTKTNGNEMVCDSPPPTNDAVSFDHIVACQGLGQRSALLRECPLGTTGTTMFSWLFFDCVLDILIKIF
jgi:hypothetical protein